MTDTTPPGLNGLPSWRQASRRFLPTGSLSHMPQGIVWCANARPGFMPPSRGLADDAMRHPHRRDCEFSGEMPPLLINSAGLVRAAYMHSIRSAS